MQRRVLVLVAAAAAVAGTGGTAVAAGELITRGDQIAPGVIESTHVKTNSIERTDQQHASVRLRVRADGGTFGDARDGTVERFGIGNYFIRFDRAALSGNVGMPRTEERWLDDCAIVATPRVGGVSSVGTGQDINLVTLRGATPGSVIVASAKPDYELKRPVPVDAPFDLAAIC